MLKVSFSYNPTSNNPEKKYYVYTHTDPKGNVFYVGKGKDGRA